MGGALACSSFAYSEDSPKVVSQGGPLGAVSIGSQNLTDPITATTVASSASENLNEKELLLKLQQQVQQLQGQLQQIKTKQNGDGNTQFKNTSGGSSKFTTYSSKVDASNTNGNANRNKSVNSTNPNSDLSKSMIGGDESDIMANVNDNSSIINLGQESLGAYSGNNSIPIGQISSNLFSSTLLGQREKFDDYSVFFGGKIEADAQTWFGDFHPKNKLDPSQANGQNIYLTAANLYFLSNLGHYVTAQFDFDTDGSGNFDLGNAFVIFGNLDTSPFFVTAGRSKLSVGTYGGVTGFLGPSNVTNVSVNYKDQVWNANIAVFGSDDKRANFSTGLFYADSWTDNLDGAFNVGYVYNIAGAGNSSITNALNSLGKNKDTVGALNVDGNLTYTVWGGFLNLGAGWASTTNSEEFNGLGTGDVLAGAWYGAANYSLVLGGRSTDFGVTYGQTYNSSAIPMGTANASPSFGQTQSGTKEQLVFSAQRAYFDDNVLFGPEWAYQKLYTGEHMNTITLDMSVYI